MEGFPEESAGFVRGKIVRSGFIFRQIEDTDSCEVSFCGCVDPQSSIPGWIIDKVAWQQGLLLAKFRTWWEKQPVHSGDPSTNLFPEKANLFPEKATSSPTG